LEHVLVDVRDPSDETDRFALICLRNEREHPDNSDILLSTLTVHSLPPDSYKGA